MADKYLTNQIICALILKRDLECVVVNRVAFRKYECNNLTVKERKLKTKTEISNKQVMRLAMESDT